MTSSDNVTKKNKIKMSIDKLYRWIIVERFTGMSETGSSSQEVTVNTIQDGLNSADCFVYFSLIGAN